MGLIGGIARTAVVAGTATAVSNRVSRRQYNRWSQQEYAQQPRYAPPPGYAPPPQYAQQPQYAQPPQYAQQPAPAAAAAPNPADDRIAKLKSLGDLHAQGILTDDEFAREKARILA
jgi:hypothetical protein